MTPMGVIGMTWLRYPLALVLALSIAGCARLASPAEADNAAAKSVVKAYWTAIAAGDSRAAEDLFVTVEGNDVRELVAKNIAYSREDTGVVAERTMSFYWLEDGILKPDAESGMVYPSEVARLSSLGQEYPMAALVTREAVSGDVTRFFVVRTDGRLRLVR